MRFVLWLLVVLVVAVGISVGWMAYEGFNDSAGSATCAIVLGSAAGPDGKPATAVQGALDRAAQLYQNKTISQVIVSGGDAPPGAAVADGMVAYLTQNGIPASVVMVDRGATSLDASARDVADYLKQNNLPSVIIVAPYYEITRAKWALSRAGVGQVLHVHSGTVQQNDLAPAAQAVTDVYVRVYRDEVAPTVTSLAKKASDEGQQLSHSVMAAATPGATNAAPAAAPADASAPAPGTGTPPPPAANAAPEATIPNPQKVSATGIADFEVPGNWTQRIVPPILDPVWAGEGIHPYFLAALKLENAGPVSSFADDVKRNFENSHFTVTGDFAQEPFTTAYGLQGVRMLGSLSASDKNFQVVAYAFPARQGNLVVLFGLCYSTDAAGEIPLLDACAKTVRPW